MSAPDDGQGIVSEVHTTPQGEDLDENGSQVGGENPEASDLSYDDDPIPERAQRRRAQAAEAELATANETLHRIRVAEIERLAADRIAVPSDLFEFGLELQEVLTDDGLVDPEKVSEAIAVVLEQRPGLATAELLKTKPVEYPSVGRTQPGPRGAKKNEWAQVFSK